MHERTTSAFAIAWLDIELGLIKIEECYENFSDTGYKFRFDNYSAEMKAGQ